MNHNPQKTQNFLNTQELINKALEDINEYVGSGNFAMHEKALYLYKNGKTTELGELIMEAIEHKSTWGQERLANILLKRADEFFMDASEEATRMSYPDWNRRGECC